MIRKQKTKAWLFSVVALVLLLSNYFSVWAEEPDPRILWVNKELNQIEGFAVHPNGNVFAYKSNMIYEIDGKDGKQISSFKSPIEIVTFNITDDGKYLVTGGAEIVKTDLETKESQKISKGDIVCCKPNSHEIAYKSWGNSDSSIVIYDMDTQARLYIKTEEAIRNIAFSPDGKYYATAGVKEDLGGNFITVFKLWDAQSLKLIKELALYNNSNKQIAKIEFSNDSKMVAFKNLDNTQINIFDIQSFKPIKNYTIESYGDYMTGFSWIENNTHIILSKSITLCNITDEFRKVIYDFTGWGHQIETDFVNNRMITRSGPPFLGSMLISWDLNKVLSNINEEIISKTISSKYYHSTLIINNLSDSSNNIRISISDVTGKLIRDLNFPTQKSEIRIPLSLPIGTYLLHLKNGNQEYSSKFIITE